MDGRLRPRLPSGPIRKLRALRDDAGRGGLAGRCVMPSSMKAWARCGRWRKGVGEGAHQRFLPDQAGEIGRAVFAGENAIRGFGHGRTIRQDGCARQRARIARFLCGKVRARHDPKRIRYGCFLPDLTGLATVSPAPNSQRQYRGQGIKLRVATCYGVRAAKPPGGLLLFSRSPSEPDRVGDRSVRTGLPLGHIGFGAKKCES